MFPRLRAHGTTAQELAKTMCRRKGRSGRSIGEDHAPQPARSDTVPDKIARWSLLPRVASDLFSFQDWNESRELCHCHCAWSGRAARWSISSHVPSPASPVSALLQRTFRFPDRPPTHCPTSPLGFTSGASCTAVSYGLAARRLGPRNSLGKRVQPAAAKARVVPAAMHSPVPDPLVVSCSLQSRPVTRSAGTGRFTGHVTTGRPAVTIASY